MSPVAPPVALVSLEADGQGLALMRAGGYPLAFPAFTWEVRANNRNYHMQFKKKFAFCLTKKKYAGNAIKTAKYNILTFLPLNLYEQFHRMANVYFVFVILLQTFPEISTLPWYTLLFPLSCLLIIRGLRDLIDDITLISVIFNILTNGCIPRAVTKVTETSTADHVKSCLGRAERGFGGNVFDSANSYHLPESAEGVAIPLFCWQKWRDICVGDIVRLHKDSFVPADMLLLCSSEPSSLCYVETADIDGETNLKFRQALLVTHQELVSEESLATFDGESLRRVRMRLSHRNGIGSALGSLSPLAPSAASPTRGCTCFCVQGWRVVHAKRPCMEALSQQGRVTCEEPNSRLHSFTGTLEWRGETYSLDSEKILLRGCKLRNTDVCYGLVIYAGFDSKIMRNCGKIKRKKTKLDRMMDRLVIIVSVVQTPALVHRLPGVAHKFSHESLLAWLMLIFLNLTNFAQNVLGLTCYGYMPTLCPQPQSNPLDPGAGAFRVSNPSGAALLTHNHAGLRRRCVLRNLQVVPHLRFLSVITSQTGHEHPSVCWMSSEDQLQAQGHLSAGLQLNETNSLEGAMIFLVLLVTSLCLAVASGFWARMFQEKHSYLSALYKHTTPFQQAFFNFWGFTILLSIIIPMSMYITFEFIYLVNSSFINWDLEMYYAVKDIPAKARSTSLNDQLGQIEYIFSDKTGTLTQNIMSFKKCCINGTIYGNFWWKPVCRDSGVGTWVPAQVASTGQAEEPQGDGPVQAQAMRTNSHRCVTPLSNVTHGQTLSLTGAKAVEDVDYTGHPPSPVSGLTWSRCREKLDFYDVTLLEAIRQDSDPVLREFLRLLALCHTVMVEEKGDQLVYQAASPDEEALVLAARNLGYVFLARTQDTITISELGKKRTYKVLAMLDFNSDRKRMSVLVRDPQGTIRLYTKGADTVILERLQRRGPNETITEMALDEPHLHMGQGLKRTSNPLVFCKDQLHCKDAHGDAHFAEETLRTLCLASKEVSEAEYSEWSRRHREASILLQDRARELDKLYEEMEQNLQLLGATAIEDKLQDGVPETIQLLQLGNIKVWVLTGDKQETAVNIGYACKLLMDDMEILEEKEISEILESFLVNINHHDGSGEAPSSGRLSQQRSGTSCHKKKAIIISGDFLDKILHTGEVLKEQKGRLWRRLARCGATGSQEQGSLVEKAFVDLATSCQAVICCRVTPRQKALIVQLVKKHKKAITLAIGDGANDVNMIKTADIGVGISGLEGMQAVQCSDYALAQFSYLQRLLLVHGRWAYLRICKFLRYFFYKTFAGLMAQVWFAFHSGFTAQPLYEGWFLALYNIFYTAYPVLSVGLLEQDVSAKKSLEFPELYVIGQKDELFNYRIFGVTVLHGVSTSLASFYIALWAFEDSVGSKAVGDYESFAVTVATSALLSVLMEIILDTKFWTALSFLMVTASLLLFCLFSFLTQSGDAFRIAPAIFPFPNASRNALTDPYVLLVVLLSLVVNTIPSLTIRSYGTIMGKASTQQGAAGDGKGKVPQGSHCLGRSGGTSPLLGGTTQLVVVSHNTGVQKIRLKARQEPEPSVELRAHVPHGSFHRRSSYAFSHQEGYANLITRGHSLRAGGTHSAAPSLLHPETTPAVSSLPSPLA
ncbi:phospholipid-transporting ATPase IK [Rhynochetos jubatus]